MGSETARTATDVAASGRAHGAARRRASAALVLVVVACVTAIAALAPAVAAAGGWSAPQTVDSATGGNTLNFVSCPTSSFCLAVDGNGDYLIDSGGTWSSPQPIHDSISSLSCTSATFCVALGINNDVTTYNGQGWSTPQIIDSNTSENTTSDTSDELDSVSCGSSTFCIAVGSSASGLVDVVDSGGTWGSPQTVDAIPNEYGDGNLVSCTPTYCGLADSLGHLFTYAYGAWSEPSDAASGAGTENYSGGISCTPAGYCLTSLSGGTEALSGGHWSAIATDPQRQTFGVSCVTASFCVSAGGSVALFDGNAWSNNATIDADDVSCATTTFCVAISSSGQAWTYTGGAFGGTSGTGTGGGAGGTSGGGTSGGSTGPVASISSPRAAVARRGGRTSIKIACNGSSVCRGHVGIYTIVEERVHRRVHGRVRTVTAKVEVTIAYGSFRVAAGRTSAVTLIVNARGLALLRSARGHRLTGVAVAATVRRATSGRELVLALT